MAYPEMSPFGGMSATPGDQAPYAGEQSQGGGVQSNFIAQEEHTDQKEMAFETAFKDAAYSLFSTKFGPMVPSIVTFKMLKSAIATGDAVGAFILNIQGETVYVPVVMSDNMMKPMEIMYSKKMDKFVPFKKQWIDVLTSAGGSALGEGIKIPENLAGDVDISRLIYPPLYGREGYAMDLSGIDHLELIKVASNDAKAQYRRMLQDDTEHLKFAFEHFDRDKILAALTDHPSQEKVASVPLKLETVDIDDPAAKVKEVFGNKGQIAAQQMAEHGFAYKDDRKDLNKVYADGESKMVLEEPTQSGVYTIYRPDGEAESAVVIANPEDLRQGDYTDGCIPNDISSPRGNVGESALGDWTSHPRKPRQHYLVILKNGDYFHTDKLIGAPGSPKDFEGSSLYPYIFGDSKFKTINAANVCFIKAEGNIIGGTQARYVDRTEVGRDGYLKYVTNDPYELASQDRKRIYGEKNAPSQRIDNAFIHCVTPTGKIVNPVGSPLVFVPLTYRAIKLGGKLSDNGFLSRASEVMLFAQRKVNETGGRTVKLANIGAGEYAINGRPAGSLRYAATKLAEDQLIPMHVAVSCLSKLVDHGDHDNIHVVPNEKTASIFAVGADGNEMSPAAVQQDAMGGPGAQQEDPGMFDQGAMSQQMMPQQPMSQIPSPEMANVGMQTQDPSLYSVGILSSLANQDDIRDLMAVYSPTLEKALDNIGRMLLTFWMRGAVARENLGNETYHSTEESLKTVFRELGTLLLRLNQTSLSSKDEPHV